MAEHPPEVEWFGWRAQPWVQDPEIHLILQFRQTASEILSYTPETCATTAGLDTSFGSFFDTPLLFSDLLEDSSTVRMSMLNSIQ
jgi:hypothetical protein